MSFSVAQCINQLRSITGQDVLTLPDTDTVDNIGALTFINRAFWDIVNKDMFKEVDLTAPFGTVAGTTTYPTPAVFDAVQHISILDPTSNQYVTLDPMDIRVYRDKQDLNVSEFTQPTNYVRYGSNIILWPTPDKVYTIQVDYIQTLIDLVAGGQFPIPREWDEIILYGAAWRVFSDVNGDMTRSQFYINLQTRQFNNTVPVQVKEEKDWSKGGVNVLGREY